MLTVAPCRSACQWAATGTSYGSARPEPLFACAGCGSEWVPSQPWSPRQVDGTEPPGVRAARQAHRQRG